MQLADRAPVAGTAEQLVDGTAITANAVNIRTGIQGDRHL